MAKEPKFSIVKAEYGADERWADVTKTVKALVVDGRLVVGIGNGPMGEDPAPDAPKSLKLAWKVGRAKHDGEFPEGTVVELP